MFRLQDGRTSGPKRCQKQQQVGRALFFGKNNPTFTCFFKHTETPSHACVHYIPIQTFKSCTVFSSNNPHIKSQNIPSWKGPLRITISNCWLHTAPPKIQIPCLRALSKYFLSSVILGPVPGPDHSGQESSLDIQHDPPPLSYIIAEETVYV